MNCCIINGRSTRYCSGCLDDISLRYFCMRLPKIFTLSQYNLRGLGPVEIFCSRSNAFVVVGIFESNKRVVFLVFNFALPSRRHYYIHKQGSQTLKLQVQTAQYGRVIYPGELRVQSKRQGAVSSNTYIWLRLPLSTPPLAPGMFTHLMTTLCAGNSFTRHKQVTSVRASHSHDINRSLSVQAIHSRYKQVTSVRAIHSHDINRSQVV